MTVAVTVPTSVRIAALTASLTVLGGESGSGAVLTLAASGGLAAARVFAADVDARRNDNFTVDSEGRVSLAGRIGSAGEQVIAVKVSDGYSQASLLITVVVAGPLVFEDRFSRAIAVAVGPLARGVIFTAVLRGGSGAQTLALSPDTPATLAAHYDLNTNPTHPAFGQLNLTREFTNAADDHEIVIIASDALAATTLTLTVNVIDGVSFTPRAATVAALLTAVNTPLFTLNASSNSNADPIRIELDATAPPFLELAGLENEVVQIGAIPYGGGEAVELTATIIASQTGTQTDNRDEFELVIRLFGDIVFDESPNNLLVTVAAGNADPALYVPSAPAFGGRDEHITYRVSGVTAPAGAPAPLRDIHYRMEPGGALAIIGGGLAAGGDYVFTIEASDGLSAESVELTVRVISAVGLSGAGVVTVVAVGDSYNLSDVVYAAAASGGLVADYTYAIETLDDSTVIIGTTVAEVDHTLRLILSDGFSSATLSLAIDVISSVRLDGAAQATLVGGRTYAAADAAYDSGARGGAAATYNFAVSDVAGGGSFAAHYGIDAASGMLLVTTPLATDAADHTIEIALTDGHSSATMQVAVAVVSSMRFANADAYQIYYLTTNERDDVIHTLAAASGSGGGDYTYAMIDAGDFGDFALNPTTRELTLDMNPNRHITSTVYIRAEDAYSATTLTARINAVRPIRLLVSVISVGALVGQTVEVSLDIRRGAAPLHRSAALNALPVGFALNATANVLTIGAGASAEVGVYTVTIEVSDGMTAETLDIVAEVSITRLKLLDIIADDGVSGQMPWAHRGEVAMIENSFAPTAAIEFGGPDGEMFGASDANADGEITVLFLDDRPYGVGAVFSTEARVSAADGSSTTLSLVFTVPDTATAGAQMHTSTEHKAIMVGGAGRAKQLTGDREENADYKFQIFTSDADDLSEWDVVSDENRDNNPRGAVAASFQGTLYMLGGHRNSDDFSDNASFNRERGIDHGGNRIIGDLRWSLDGVHWVSLPDKKALSADGAELDAAKAPWRSYGGELLVHCDRPSNCSLLRIGGGYRDNEGDKGKNYIWQTKDGINWSRSLDQVPYAGVGDIDRGWEDGAVSAASLNGTLYIYAASGGSRANVRVYRTTATNFRQSVDWEEIGPGSDQIAPNGNSWRANSSSNTYNGVGAKIIAFNGRIFIVGGYSGNGDTIAYLKLDDEGRPYGWKKQGDLAKSYHSDSDVSSHSGYQSLGARAVVYGNHLYIVGGSNMGFGGSSPYSRTHANARHSLERSLNGWKSRDENGDWKSSYDKIDIPSAGQSASGAIYPRGIVGADIVIHDASSFGRIHTPHDDLISLTLAVGGVSRNLFTLTAVTPISGAAVSMSIMGEFADRFTIRDGNILRLIAPFESGYDGLSPNLTVRLSDGVVAPTEVSLQIRLLSSVQFVGGVTLVTVTYIDTIEPRSTIYIAHATGGSGDYQFRFATSNPITADYRFTRSHNAGLLQVYDDPQEAGAHHRLRLIATDGFTEASQLVSVRIVEPLRMADTTTTVFLATGTVGIVGTFHTISVTGGSGDYTFFKYSGAPSAPSDYRRRHNVSGGSLRFHTGREWGVEYFYGVLPAQNPYTLVVQARDGGLSPDVLHTIEVFIADRQTLVLTPNVIDITVTAGVPLVGERFHFFFTVSDPIRPDRTSKHDDAHQYHVKRGAYDNARDHSSIECYVETDFTDNGVYSNIQGVGGLTTRDYFPNCYGSFLRDDESGFTPWEAGKTYQWTFQMRDGPAYQRFHKNYGTVQVHVLRGADHIIEVHEEGGLRADRIDGFNFRGSLATFRTGGLATVTLNSLPLDHNGTDVTVAGSLQVISREGGSVIYQLNLDEPGPYGADEEYLIEAIASYEGESSTLTVTVRTPENAVGGDHIHTDASRRPMMFGAMGNMRNDPNSDSQAIGRYAVYRWWNDRGWRQLRTEVTTSTTTTTVSHWNAKVNQSFMRVAYFKGTLWAFGGHDKDEIFPDRPTIPDFHNSYVEYYAPGEVVDDDRIMRFERRKASGGGFDQHGPDLPAFPWVYGTPWERYGGELMVYGDYLMQFGGVNIFERHLSYDHFWMSTDGINWSYFHDAVWWNDRSPVLPIREGDRHINRAQSSSISGAVIKGTFYIYIPTGGAGTDMRVWQWKHGPEEFLSTRDGWDAWRDISPYVSDSVEPPDSGIATNGNGVGSQMIAFNDRLFILGGAYNHGRQIVYSKHDAAGNVIGWGRSDLGLDYKHGAGTSRSLEQNGWSRAFVWGKYLYVVGGNNDNTGQNFIERSKTGLPGTWEPVDIGNNGFARPGGSSSQNQYPHAVFGMDIVVPPPSN